MEIENKKNCKLKTILVYYIGVANVDNNDIEEYIRRITKSIMIEDFDGHIVVIPTQSNETRIECINPVYLTKKKLLKKHKRMISELDLHLQNQINQIENSEE